MGSGDDQRTLGRERGERAVLSGRQLRDMAQRVDDRVARDLDAFRDPLATEISAAASVGAKCQRVTITDATPVHLLRKRWPRSPERRPAST